MEVENRTKKNEEKKPSPEALKLSGRLNDMLKAYGLNQAHVAKEVGIATSTISNYYSGKKEASLRFLMALLKHYPDLSADWLMRGEGEMNKKKEEVKSESYEELEDEIISLRGELKGLQSAYDRLLDRVSGRTNENRYTQEKSLVNVG